MPTVGNRYEVATNIKRRSRKKRRCYMTKRKRFVPRKEEECVKHVASFLNRDKDKYKSNFCIKNDEAEHFIPEIGKCVISDAAIYATYAVEVDEMWFQKQRRVISIEFEEHRRDYSILSDTKKCPAIHVPSRKLHYYRPYDAQYWIKIDNDGTPICIPYRYIALNSKELNDIGAQGNFTNRGQTHMVKAAVRDRDGKFPPYVIVGWRAVFKEFRRILKAY
ncbi:unnamed protein product, partial [marine sediment metagenome]